MYILYNGLYRLLHLLPIHDTDSGPKQSSSRLECASMAHHYTPLQIRPVQFSPCSFGASHNSNTPASVATHPRLLTSQAPPNQYGPTARSAPLSVPAQWSNTLAVEQSFAPGSESFHNPAGQLHGVWMTFAGQINFQSSTYYQYD